MPPLTVRGRAALWEGTPALGLGLHPLGASLLPTTPQPPRQQQAGTSPEPPGAPHPGAWGRGGGAWEQVPARSPTFSRQSVPKVEAHRPSLRGPRCPPWGHQCPGRAFLLPRARCLRREGSWGSERAGKLEGVGSCLRALGHPLLRSQVRRVFSLLSWWHDISTLLSALWGVVWLGAEFCLLL